MAQVGLVSYRLGHACFCFLGELVVWVFFVFYHSTNIWQNFSIESFGCWDFFVGKFWVRTYCLRHGTFSSRVDDFSLKEVAHLSCGFTFIGIKLSTDPQTLLIPRIWVDLQGALCPSAWHLSLLTTLSSDYQFINFRVVFDFINYCFQLHWSVFVCNYGDYFACCGCSWLFFF